MRALGVCSLERRGNLGAAGSHRDPVTPGPARNSDRPTRRHRDYSLFHRAISVPTEIIFQCPATMCENIS
jgi:hypothetical protein